MAKYINIETSFGASECFWCRENCGHKSFKMSNYIFINSQFYSFWEALHLLFGEGAVDRDNVKNWKFYKVCQICKGQIIKWMLLRSSKLNHSDELIEDIFDNETLRAQQRIENNSNIQRFNELRELTKKLLIHGPGEKLLFANTL